MVALSTALFCLHSIQYPLSTSRFHLQHAHLQYKVHGPAKWNNNKGYLFYYYVQPWYMWEICEYDVMHVECSPGIFRQLKQILHNINSVQWMHDFSCFPCTLTFLNLNPACVLNQSEDTTIRNGQYGKILCHNTWRHFHDTQYILW